MATPSSNDLKYIFLKNALGTAYVNGTVDGIPGAGIIMTPFVDESKASAGVVTAPIANAGLVSIPAPLSGLYRFHVTAATMVTPGAAADDNNIEVRLGAVSKAVCKLSRTNNTYLETIGQVRCDGVGNLTVNAIGAATAAVVYSVHILATRIAL